MSKRQYDFAGWVTKNDTLCMDGVTIKQNAFQGNEGHTVPLVWNHNYNSPNNVLGHMELSNKPNGVYGFGYLNETEEGMNAKELIRHGDITSMSIGARKIKRMGTDVVHGIIYEVSLVMSGANPGAKIESVITHAEDGNLETATIWTGTLIHSAEQAQDMNDELRQNENKEESIKHAEGEKEKGMSKTVAQVIEELTDEQKEAVYGLIGSVVEAYEDSEDDDLDDLDDDDEDDDEGDDSMKQNVFNNPGDFDNSAEILRHSMVEGLQSAIKERASSLKQVLQDMSENDDTITHGINSIEMLFPEAMASTNGSLPLIYKDPNTAYAKILAGVTKSPFSRVKTLVADLTEEEARANGYIKGNLKKEEFFSLVKRVTTPQTIYKKQKLDRDDIIDITDFDIVAFMNREMKMMLEEEVARAILVGDGRDVNAPEKIFETNVRPIISDHEFFVVQKAFANAAAFIEAVIRAMTEYRGSGTPDMFIDPVLLADVKLLKGTDGRYLFGDIPSTVAVATRLGLNDIIPTTFMRDKGAIIVNLKDYTIGSTKGGEITNFDDFDIDFNQYKYLIETRLCGALTMPKSAVKLTVTTAATGANATAGGLTYGDRQADKPVVPPVIP